MLPRLRQLERDFAGSVAVIGVHSPKFPAERDGDNLRKAMLRYRVDHPVLNDATFTVWQSYAVRAWPTLMFLDPHGRVIGKHEGEFDLNTVRGFVTAAIAEFEQAGEIDRFPLPHRPEMEKTSGLRFPEGLLADAPGDRLFIADTGNHRIVVTGLDGEVRLTIGSGIAGFADGSAATACFDSPRGVALDPSGQLLYVADTGNHAIRAVDLPQDTVTTVAGTGERAHRYEAGSGRQTALASPWDVAWLDDRLWIAMAGAHQLWTYHPARDLVAPAAGTGFESIHDGLLATATFAQPSGVTALDGVLYVADSETSAIRRVDPANDRVRRLVGRGLFEFGDVDAVGDSVRLQHPLGVAATFEDSRPVIYIADSYNDKIKRLDPPTRSVTTMFGGDGHGFVDGAGAEVEFWEPTSLSLIDRTLYIADTNNHAIRVANLDNGSVETLKITQLP